jgi:hypothetical protein
MYNLGEVNFIQGMLDFGNPKNSVGLKHNAELRKDANPLFGFLKKHTDITANIHLVTTVVTSSLIYAITFN